MTREEICSLSKECADAVRGEIEKGTELTNTEKNEICRAFYHWFCDKDCALCNKTTKCDQFRDFQKRTDKKYRSKIKSLIKIHKALVRKLSAYRKNIVLNTKLHS